MHVAHSSAPCCDHDMLSHLQSGFVADVQGRDSPLEGVQA